VKRGGSWNNNGRNLRSANRDNNAPANRNNNVGFRLARPQPRGMLISRGTAASREKERHAVFRAFERRFPAGTVGPLP
jgi:hypothetical protein